ncbi:hypothetical protein [Rhizobium sp. GN54]|uniref:hypothetical protein n=1 Tax=Rhizobium sp. GN54 TaxID=2898150 RepID=UPI001E327F22|nr:hypothetical protein [Rhizobium sp. GN54]MCD2184216.1 hypothetical protein [Rhizobium sp. GN54]
MFGKSVFESVLERLREEEDAGQAAPVEDTGEAVRSAHPDFTVLSTGRPSVAPGAAAAAYRDLDGFDAPGRAEPVTQADPPAEAAPATPEPPPHLLRTGPEAIAADLGLTGKETRAQLADIRRAFARDNHPDTAPPEFRENATRRMMIANMLIDETLRRMQAETSLGLRR